MSRRSFLGRIGRWSTALAVFGLGPEAWMRVASRGSIVSSAVAAEATRDRRLHPFPSDDPYNMPLGKNVWYASTSDPATSDFLKQGCGLTMTNAGWSHPVYMPSISDPLMSIRMWDEDTARGSHDGANVRSYRPEENGQKSLNERLQTTVVPAIPSGGGWGDRHLHILFENELVENFRWDRLSDTASRSKKIVRNRLDRYSFGRSLYWDHPLRNTHGCRAWGGSAIAGLIRKHEIEGPNPYIPHALAINLVRNKQISGYQQGDSSSPTYNLAHMFPATVNDYGFSNTAKYPSYTDPNGNVIPPDGNCRMGMRFALDPNTCTDAWINANAPNPVQAALARAMRDYGIIVADETRDSCPLLATEHAVSNEAASLVYRWKWVLPYVRRVGGAGPLHNPEVTHWETWRGNGEGWGGGSPRVPYSPPLAPLSGDVPPPASPEAPGAIQVTGAWAFDGTT
jgi:hypothetical protein